MGWLKFGANCDPPEIDSIINLDKKLTFVTAVIAGHSKLWSSKRLGVSTINWSEKLVRVTILIAGASLMPKSKRLGNSTINWSENVLITGRLKSWDSKRLGLLNRWGCMDSRTLGGMQKAGSHNFWVVFVAKQKEISWSCCQGLCWDRKLLGMRWAVNWDRMLLDNRSRNIIRDWDRRLLESKTITCLWCQRIHVKVCLIAP